MFISHSHLHTLLHRTASDLSECEYQGGAAESVKVRGAKKKRETAGTFITYFNGKMEKCMLCLHHRTTEQTPNKLDDVCATKASYRI